MHVGGGAWQSGHNSSGGNPSIISAVEQTKLLQSRECGLAEENSKSPIGKWNIVAITAFGDGIDQGP